MFNSEEYLSNIAIPNFADPELTVVAKEMTDAVKTPDANEFAKVAMQTISPMGIGENIQSDFPLQTEGQKADSQRSNQQFNADTPVGLSQMQLQIAQDDLINAEMRRRAQDKYNAWRQAKINQAKIVNTVNQQNNFNDSLIPSNQLLQNLKDSSKSDLKPTIDFTLPIQDFQNRTAVSSNFLPSDEFKKSLENNLSQKSDNTSVNVKNPFLPGESKQIKLDVLTHGLLNSLTSVVDPILKKFNLSASNIPVISTGNATNDKIFGGIGEIIGTLPSLIGAGGVASSLAKNIASPLLKTIITGGGTFALAGAPNNFLSLATGEQTWGKTAERLGSDLLFGAAFSKLPKGTTAKDVLGLLGAATLGYTQSAVSNRDFGLTEDNLVNAGIITLLHGFGLSKDGKVDPKVEKVITEVKDKVEKPEELKNSINELKKITIEDNGNEIQKEKGLQEINAADTNIPEKTSIPMQENVVKQEIPAEDLTKKVQNGQPLTDQEIDTVINNNIDVSKPVVETPKSPDNGNLVGIDKAYNLKKMDEWGVEPPESSLPGDKQLFETVKNNFAEGKYDDKYINDTIANADKGWSAEQNNVMKIVRKENDFEYRRLYKEQQKAIESGDEAAYNELKKQADYCLAGDRKIGDAATLSNKVNSQNLRSIGGRIDDDYNVVRVIREATDLNSGVELSPEKHQQFVEAVEKYETAKLELKTKNDEIEKLRNDLELQKNINRINSEVKSENAKREYSARSGERANKVATVKEKRTVLLDDLTKLYVSQSSQLNAKIIPFGDIQSMNILRKLAGTYIEEGVIKAADVLDKMYTDLKAKFPDGVFTKEDISRAITGYGREVQKEIESKTNRMQDLKKALILNSKIEDLKNGNKPYARKKGMMKTANEEITRLQNEYNTLSDKLKLSNEYRLEQAKSRIQKNIEKLDQDIKTLKQGQIPEKPNKKNVNDLRADQTLKKQREEVARKKLEIQGMLEDIKRQNELTIREQFRESPLKTIGKGLLHIPGVAKTIKATLDFSMLLRQGVRTLLTNPDIWAKNALKVFSDTMGTIKGKDVIKEVNIEIMSRENFPKMVEDKLAVGVTEEAYPDSEILTKIPIFGKLHKVSEVTYEAFMRRIRADLYDKYTTALEKSGIEETTGQGLGKLVNSLTGRGNLGRLEAVGDVVNVVAFAPRLVKSHLDVFSAHAFDSKMSWAVKKIAVKNLLKIMAGMATVGAIANIIRPGSAETDPRSKNFGKIKAGNTTFDYTGGMASLLVLGSQIASQSTKSPLNDRIRKLGGASFGSQTGMDVLVNYLRGKASPITSLGVDIINQKDFLGKPITVQGELVNLFAPLPANTAYELLTTPDAANFYVGMLADMLGVSTNTYTANDQFGMSKEIASIKSEQENLAELKQKVIDTKNITDKRNLRDEYNKRYRELERQKYKSKEYQEYLKAQEKKKLEKNKQFNN